LELGITGRGWIRKGMRSMDEYRDQDINCLLFWTEKVEERIEEITWR
jgi:hypothetical protein